MENWVVAVGESSVHPEGKKKVKVSTSTPILSEGVPTTPPAPLQRSSSHHSHARRRRHHHHSHSSFKSSSAVHPPELLPTPSSVVLDNQSPTTPPAVGTTTTTPILAATTPTQAVGHHANSPSNPGLAGSAVGSHLLFEFPSLGYETAALPPATPAIPPVLPIPPPHGVGGGAETTSTGEVSSPPTAEQTPQPLQLWAGPTGSSPTAAGSPRHDSPGGSRHEAAVQTARGTAPQTARPGSSSGGVMGPMSARRTGQRNSKSSRVGSIHRQTGRSNSVNTRGSAGPGDDFDPSLLAYHTSMRPTSPLRLPAKALAAIDSIVERRKRDHEATQSAKRTAAELATSAASPSVEDAEERRKLSEQVWKVRNDQAWGLSFTPTLEDNAAPAQKKVSLSLGSSPALGAWSVPSQPSLPPANDEAALLSNFLMEGDERYEKREHHHTSSRKDTTAAPGGASLGSSVASVDVAAVPPSVPLDPHQPPAAHKKRRHRHRSGAPQSGQESADVAPSKAVKEFADEIQTYPPWYSASDTDEVEKEEEEAVVVSTTRKKRRSRHSSSRHRNGKDPTDENGRKRHSKSGEQRRRKDSSEGEGGRRTSTRRRRRRHHHPHRGGGYDSSSSSSSSGEGDSVGAGSVNGDENAPLLPYDPDHPHALASHVSKLEEKVKGKQDAMTLLSAMGLRPSTALENAAIPYWLARLQELLFYSNAAMRDPSSPQRMPADAAVMLLESAIGEAEKLLEAIQTSSDGGVSAGTPGAKHYEVCTSTSFPCRQLEAALLAQGRNASPLHYPFPSSTSMEEGGSATSSAATATTGMMVTTISLNEPTPKARKGDAAFVSIRFDQEDQENEDHVPREGLSPTTSADDGGVANAPAPLDHLPLERYEDFDKADLAQPLLMQTIPLWRRHGAAEKTVRETLVLLRDRLQVLRTSTEGGGAGLDALVAPHFMGIDGQQCDRVAPALGGLSQSTLTQALLSDVFSSPESAFSDRARRIREAMETQIPVLHDRYLVEHAFSPLYNAGELQPASMLEPLQWVKAGDRAKYQSYSVHVDYLRLQPSLAGLGFLGQYTMQHRHRRRRGSTPSVSLGPSRSPASTSPDRPSLSDSAPPRTATVPEESVVDLQRSWTHWQQLGMVDHPDPKSAGVGRSRSSRRHSRSKLSGGHEHEKPGSGQRENAVPMFSTAGSTSAGQSQSIETLDWEKLRADTIQERAKRLATLATFITSAATTLQQSLVQFTVEDLLQADLLDHYEKYRLLQLNLLANLKSRVFYAEQLEYLRAHPEPGLEEKTLQARLEALHDEAARLERHYILHMVLDWCAILLVRVAQAAVHPLPLTTSAAHGVAVHPHASTSYFIVEHPSSAKGIMAHLLQSRREQFENRGGWHQELRRSLLQPTSEERRVVRTQQVIDEEERQRDRLFHDDDPALQDEEEEKREMEMRGRPPQAPGADTASCSDALENLQRSSDVTPEEREERRRRRQEEAAEAAAVASGIVSAHRPTTYAASSPSTLYGVAPTTPNSADGRFRFCLLQRPDASTKREPHHRRRHHSRNHRENTGGDPFRHLCGFGGSSSHSSSPREGDGFSSAGSTTTASHHQMDMPETPYVVGTDPLRYEPVVEAVDTILAVPPPHDGVSASHHRTERSGGGSEGGETDFSASPHHHLRDDADDSDGDGDRFLRSVEHLRFFQVLVFARFDATSAPQFIGCTRPRPLTASKIVFYNETFEIRSSKELKEVLLHVVPVATESSNSSETRNKKAKKKMKGVMDGVAWAPHKIPPRTVASTTRLLPSRQRSYVLLPLQAPTAFTFGGTVFSKYVGEPLSGFVAASSTWTSTQGLSIEAMENMFLQPPYADPMDPQYLPFLQVLQHHYEERERAKTLDRRKKMRGRIREGSAFRPARVLSPTWKDRAAVEKGKKGSPIAAILAAVELRQRQSRKQQKNYRNLQEQYESIRFQLLSRRWHIASEKAKAASLLEARLFYYPIPLYEEDNYRTQRRVEKELQEEEQETRNSFRVRLDFDFERYYQEPAAISGLAYASLPIALKAKLWQERQRRLKLTNFSSTAAREITDENLLARYVTVPRLVMRKLKLLEPRSELNPRRKERPKNTDIDRELLKRQQDSHITVHLMKATNLPERADGSPLEPFVEAQFVYGTTYSRSMVGSSPSWFQTLQLPFHPYDFDEETLRLIDDDIVLSIYDKVQEPMSLHPNPILGAHESHFRTERRLLCSMRIPFAALHQAEQARMEGVYTLHTPRWLLGYKNPSVKVSGASEARILKSISGEGITGRIPTTVMDAGSAGGTTLFSAGDQIRVGHPESLGRSTFGSPNRHPSAGSARESLSGSGGGAQSVSRASDAAVAHTFQHTMDSNTSGWKPKELPTLQLYIALWPPLQRPRKEHITLVDLQKNIVPSLHVGPQLRRLHQSALKWKRTADSKMKAIGVMNHFAARRHVDPFVRCSTGDFFLICRYLLPEGCPPPPSVRTLHEAIRYVALLPCLVNATEIGEVYDSEWSPNAEMIALRSRRYTEQGLLLYHFLRHLSPKEEVYVLTGEGEMHPDSMMLLHKLGGASWHLIDPLTGTITRVAEPHGTALKDVRSIFSPHQIWANVQLSGLPHRMSWDFEDTRNWMTCFTPAESADLALHLSPIQRPVLPFLPVDNIKAKAIELELLEALRTALRGWRSHRAPCVRKGIGRILRAALVRAEEELCSSGSWDPGVTRSLEEELYKYLGERHLNLVASGEEAENDLGDSHREKVSHPSSRHSPGKRSPGRGSPSPKPVGATPDWALAGGGSSVTWNGSLESAAAAGPLASNAASVTSAGAIRLESEEGFGLSGAPVTETYHDSDVRFRHILQQVYQCATHEVGTDEVDFGMGVYVKSYSGDVFAMWVFLVAIFPKKPMI